MKSQFPIKGFKNSSELLAALSTKPESFWIKRGEKMALDLFHKMAVRVPAYKDFLRKNKVDPEKIKVIKDFKQVPTIDKNNYLRSYPRESVFWDGKFPEGSWVISATSGSTGEPFYFPRTSLQDWQYATTAELYLLSNFEIDKKKTLYIVGFPMGVWIGGVFTYQALKYVIERGGYNLSIITPGINKPEIIKTVKNLGHHFDQILIGSYGPFLKDIIDDGIDQGLDWKKYKLGFIFSAEGFSETFRDYIIEKTGVKDIYKGTLNHYGTVDLGTMSHETPLAILIRRITLTDAKLYKEIFSEINKLPTLTQYLPEMFFFEESQGGLICSADSGIPLVRYDLKDHGGILTLSDMRSKFNSNNKELYKEAGKAGISTTIWNLPFVHVYERSDFSVSFFAFQIYPETIRKALQNESLEKFITGKFTMMVTYDKNSEQIFEVHVELKSHTKESELLREQVSSSIQKKLLEENSEYRKTTEEFPNKTVPAIIFWPYEDPTYFKPGTKQKWVKKN